MSYKSLDIVIKTLLEKNILIKQFNNYISFIDKYCFIIFKAKNKENNQVYFGNANLNNVKFKNYRLNKSSFIDAQMKSSELLQVFFSNVIFDFNFICWGHILFE